MDNTSNGIVSLPDAVYHSYWYEEKPHILKTEFLGLEYFEKHYNSEYFSYETGIVDGKFCVDVVFPIQFSEHSSLEFWALHMVYDHGHPYIQVDNGRYGGSIRIYVADRCKMNTDGTLSPLSVDERHHHFVRETGNPNSPVYMCQRKVARPSEVNSYAALKQAARWITNYIIWERTGIDKDGMYHAHL